MIDPSNKEKCLISTYDNKSVIETKIENYSITVFVLFSPLVLSNIVILVTKVRKLRSPCFHYFMQTSLMLAITCQVIGVALFRNTFSALLQQSVEEWRKTDHQHAVRVLKLGSMLLTLCTFITLIAIGLFVVKYWLMTKKVLLLMQERNDIYLELKGQLLFGLIVLIALVSLIANTILIAKHQFFTNNNETARKAMFLFLAVPCFLWAIVLTDSVWTLRKIKQFELSKLQIILLYGIDLLFSLAFTFNAIDQFQTSFCINFIKEMNNAFIILSLNFLGIVILYNILFQLILLQAKIESSGDKSEQSYSTGMSASVIS